VVATDFLNPDTGFGLWLMSAPADVLADFDTQAEGAALAIGQRSGLLPAVVSRPDAVLIDFDVDGKTMRQERAEQLLGHGTTISQNGFELLERALSRPIAPVLARLGRYDGEASDRMIRDFQERGVVGFLLSMVEHESEIEQARKALAPGIALGAMIETPGAVGRIDQFRQAGLDFAFIGLVDLAIQRSSPSIFSPLVDGTMAHMSAKLAGIPFGFGAATVVGGGAPVPNRLLLGEMARHDARFTLLRSAFYRDIEGKSAPAEVRALRDVLATLHERDSDAVAADSRELGDRLGELLRAKSAQ